MWLLISCVRMARTQPAAYCFSGGACFLPPIHAETLPTAAPTYRAHPVGDPPMGIEAVQFAAASGVLRQRLCRQSCCAC